MTCLICKDLERTLDYKRSKCFEARSAAYYQVSAELAAQKNVDMERAIRGTVLEDGEKLRFVTEQRAWRVDNPELLKGHEGHYVHAAAYIYPDKNLIHIIEVKTASARETREADIK
jgi:hypothetical protein